MEANAPFLLSLQFQRGRSLSDHKRRNRLDYEQARPYWLGSGDDWDRIYNGTNEGWSEELENLRTWLEEGKAKVWA